MIACFHCKRNVADNAESCPFCMKNPQPPAETKEATSPKFKIRIGSSSADKEKEKDEEKKVEDEKANQDIAREIIQKLSLGPDGARDKAIDFLLSGGGLAIEKDLIDALNIPSISGKDHIVKALGRMKSRAAIPVLMQILNSAETDMRLAAAWSLFRIGDMRALAVLMENMKDADPQVRNYITYAVGSLGDPEAAPKLLKMVEDPSPEIRAQALLSIAFLEGRKSIPILKKSMKDPDLRVRKIASEAMLLIGDSSNQRKKLIYITLGSLAAALILAVILRLLK